MEWPRAESHERLDTFLNRRSNGKLVNTALEDGGIRRWTTTGGATFFLGAFSSGAVTDRAVLPAVVSGAVAKRAAFDARATRRSRP